MFMADRLTVDGSKRDSAGNLIACVLAARTGCQDYAGYEVGKPEMAKVTVYRPADEVFSRDSMASFASAPVTIEHPAEPVTPTNWKDHAIGETSEEIVRDGEAVRVPFLVRDAKGIAAIEDGKREISMGYSCDLTFEDGNAPDGTAYQAVQRGIRINHLAIVDKARGGPTLRIGDKEPAMKIKIGDTEVEVTDGAAVAVAVGALNAKLADAEGKVGTLTADLATANTALQTKDGEVVALTASLADATNPVKLQQLAADRAAIIGKAKVIAPSLTIADADTNAVIKKNAVLTKLGDAAKDMADASIDGAFAALTNGIKANDAVASALAGGLNNIGDAQARETAALASSNDHNAWRNAG